MQGTFNLLTTFSTSGSTLPLLILPTSTVDQAPELSPTDKEISEHYINNYHESALFKECKIQGQFES